MIDWVDRRLEAWGEWSVRHGAGLGWPSTTIGYRIQEQGATGAAIRGRGKYEDMPEAIAEIEEAILTLPSDMQQTLKVRYLHPHWPTKACAEALGLSLHRFYLRIEGAHHWIAGRLSAAPA